MLTLNVNNKQVTQTYTLQVSTLEITNLNITSWTPERSTYITFAYSNSGAAISSSDLDVVFRQVEDPSITYRFRVQPASFTSNSFEIFSNGLQKGTYNILITHSSRGRFACSIQFVAETYITGFSKQSGSELGG